MTQQQQFDIRAIDAELKECSDFVLKAIAEEAPRGQLASWQLTEQQQRAIRAVNELARRTAVTRQAEAQAAEHQKIATQQQEALEAYRTTARGAFPGTDEAFTRVWPQLRDQWLVEQTQARMGNAAARIAAKKASSDYSL